MYRIKCLEYNTYNGYYQIRVFFLLISPLFFDAKFNFLILQQFRDANFQTIIFLKLRLFFLDLTSLFDANFRFLNETSDLKSSYSHLKLLTTKFRRLKIHCRLEIFFTVSNFWEMSCKQIKLHLASQKTGKKITKLTTCI